MDFTVRKAVMNDYESVVEIMNQVQQMHVNWRLDIYKLNNNIIPQSGANSKLIGDDKIRAIFSSTADLLPDCPAGDKVRVQKSI